MEVSNAKGQGNLDTNKAKLACFTMIRVFLKKPISIKTACYSHKHLIFED